jgi:hypothetical protein
MRFATQKEVARANNLRKFEEAVNGGDGAQTMFWIIEEMIKEAIQETKPAPEKESLAIAQRRLRAIESLVEHIQACANIWENSGISRVRAITKAAEEIKDLASLVESA